MATKNTTTKNLYFVTTTVVNWVDIFSRPKYKHIIIESLAFCQKTKGLEIYAWVLMPNHLRVRKLSQNFWKISRRVGESGCCSFSDWLVRRIRKSASIIFGRMGVILK